ncbi:hypothetical protein SteCoe_17778 [Stentor coeruleus]|uniref:Transmembrane 9 superfamily member n=1 Tax=Stentor coeruleus TaxID=5963 RepID=A0A1R2BY52_9CILI|nr:hypothetical protein SteCoe_17778 [Stentor coeruleus]
MLAFLTILLAWGYGFNIPGILPRDYPEGHHIEIQVRELHSTETQLPFDYYYLNFCKPEGMNVAANENIAEILTGDQREKSPYFIEMNIEKICVKVCDKKNNKEQIANFKWMIDNNYYASWVLDGLPSGLRKFAKFERNEYKVSFYQDGFPIGYRLKGKYYVFNHANIFVKVYFDGENWRIVGFLVEPLSLNNDASMSCLSENFSRYINITKMKQEIILPPDEMIESMNYEGLPQELQKEIVYTYSTFFEKSDIKWASRWDMYTYGAGSKTDVHWLSIINSFALVLFLSSIIAHILCRTIRNDISNYNDSTELEIRETGWKQIRGEIFRRPAYANLFCMIIGSGVQLICTSFVGLGCAYIGFLSPSYREIFLIFTFIMYMLFGTVSGYVSARFYKMFELKRWKINILGTALLYPGVCIVVFIPINACVMSEESSAAVPFTAMFFWLFLWFGIFGSLVYLGGGYGNLKDTISNPCKVNKIPRPISFPVNLRMHFVYFLAGSLPFGCMFMELSYVMKSMWHHTLFYYLFGFSLLCYIVLIITSAEVSILMTYLLLCREDYRWWWISVEVAGSSGIYFFIYAFGYYYAELNFSRISSFVFYFGYMFLASATFSVITGTIGFLATFVFIRTIYSLIKSD